VSRSRFGVLVRLALRHDWFADGALRRVEYLLGADAQHLLARGRLQARVRDGVLHLLVERDEGGAPRIALPEGSTLWIGVRPDLAALAHVTLPLAQAGRCALFEQRAAVDAFDAPRSVVLASAFAPVPLTGLASPRTLVVFDDDAREVARQTVAQGDDPAALDLRRLPIGRYAVEASDGAAPVQRSDWLLHPELHAAGVSIVAALTLSPALYAAPQPPTLEIALAAPSQALEYYVVARNFAANEFNQLAVRDRGFGDEGRPEIEFDRIAEADLDPATDLAPAQLGADAGARIALFRSRAAVARRERAPRRISLGRNGDVLVEHLPAAGAERARPQFVIHLAKP
jgi:hypothetical protein